MPAPINPLKAALAAGKVLRGPFLSLGSEAVTGIAGRAGFDFCLIDGEHGPFDPGLIARQLTALSAAACPAVVRVPWQEGWLVRQVLDMGAQSVMVPMVDTAEAAAELARASLYPPEGGRGFGGANMAAGQYGALTDYAATANAQICLILQIESRAAMDRIEAIAAVPGVDALFLGPADLGCDMGLRDDLGAPALWDAVADGVRRIAATGRAAGVFAPPDREAEMVAAGARLIGVGSDAGTVTVALRRLAGAP
jgi:4-hydroxy-2-oxoheptanedioate aldolase